MKRLIVALMVWSVLVIGCAAIPASVQEKALPEMPFPVLVQQARQYIGETLILGGYVLEVRNSEGDARIVAIQAPLDEDQKPKTRNLSQGLLILKYHGFLDPEVYVKDCKITVAGNLIGSSATKEVPSHYPFVELRLTHIHPWSE